jgi:hypothetical protein
MLQSGAARCNAGYNTVQHGAARCCSTLQHVSRVAAKNLRKWSRSSRAFTLRVASRAMRRGSRARQPPSGGCSAQARSRKAEQEEAIAAKEAKKNMDPRELFRAQTDLYSKFDADGLPTHDTQGAELSKSKVKALKKDWDKQKKLYDAAHK